MTSTTPSAPFPPLGTSLYYALKCVPAQRRDALRTWWQWWHETSQIPLTVSDPGVADTKLRWWLQELQACAQDTPTHPLTQALHAITHDPPHTTGRAALWPLCSEQIQAQLDLVQHTRWMDPASLDRHRRASTGAACEGAALLLGAAGPEVANAARLLGAGLRMAHQVARLGQDARAGWVHVPIDVLQAHDVRAHQVSKPQLGQAPAGWPGLLAHLITQADQALVVGMDAARALPSPTRQALRPLLVLAFTQRALLAALRPSGELVLHQRLVLTPLRKWWIAQRVRWGVLA